MLQVELSQSHASRHYYKAAVQEQAGRQAVQQPRHIPEGGWEAMLHSGRRQSSCSAVLKMVKNASCNQQDYKCQHAPKQAVRRHHAITCQTLQLGVCICLRDSSLGTQGRYTAACKQGTYDMLLMQIGSPVQGIVNFKSKSVSRADDLLELPLQDIMSLCFRTRSLLGSEILQMRAYLRQVCILTAQ